MQWKGLFFEVQPIRNIFKPVVMFLALGIFVFLVTAPVAAEPGVTVPNALKSYYANEPTEALKILDNALLDRNLSDKQKTSLGYWSLRFRIENMLYDDAFWQHINILQELDKKKYSRLRWTMSQAALASYSIAIV